MSLIKLLGVWVILAAAMIANGILRVTVLQTRFGLTTAEILSAVFGIIIILAVTRPFLRPLAGATPPELLIVSVAWVVLTVIFEFTFGHWVDGKSWSELAGNYAVWRGRLWPLVLMTLAATPFIWARPTKARPRRGNR
jgi:hypothetical protein